MNSNALIKILAAANIIVFIVIAVICVKHFVIDAKQPDETQAVTEVETTAETTAETTVETTVETTAEETEEQTTLQETEEQTTAPAQTETEGESDTEAAQDAEGYMITVSYADKDWYPSYFYNQELSAPLISETQQFTGDGTYTVSLVKDPESTISDFGQAEGVVVFCVDIVGLGKELGLTGGLTDKVSIDSMTINADGTEYEADPTKLMVGNIEGNGNLRIEIYNSYGYVDGERTTVNDCCVDNLEDMKWSESLSVTFTISGYDK